MQAARDEKQAASSIDTSFLEEVNKGKADKDQWKLVYDEDNPTTLKVIPPKSAKAGDFVAVPLTYTYTNGSTDVHWFHFVVQETDNKKPSYEVKVDYPSKEMKSPVTVEKNEKKLDPVKYTIESDTYTDDKGNKWSVSIDQETGEVTAKPKDLPDGKTFDGGEKLQVPVTAHYKDQADPDKDITEETIAEFVLKEKSFISPDYDAQKGKAGEELSSLPSLDEGDTYNKKPSKYTLADGSLTGTYKDENENEWNVSINPKNGEVTATVPKAADGKTIDINGVMITVPVTAHYEDAEGKEIETKKANVQFFGSGTEGSYEYTEEIPFETKVEVAKDLAPGQWRYKVVNGKKQTGANGSVTKEITIKDSKVEGEPKEIKRVNPTNAIIEIGGQPVEDTKTVEKEIKTKIVYVDDDTLEFGVVKEGEYTPGKVVTEIVYEYNPETGKIEAREKTTVTDAVQVIIKGTKKTDNTCPVIPTPDPDQPDKPVTPDEPDKPVTPDTPDPEKPDKPQEPETPDTPDTPEKPEKPEEPGTPETPETPEIPENPETPEIPENPEDPGTPDKPENPEEPETSDKPNESSDKETPETPETPDSPKENLKEEKKEETGKVKQNKDKSKNPKTGIESIAPIFTSMGISIAGLMATRKKKEDK